MKVLTILLIMMATIFIYSCEDDANTDINKKDKDEKQTYTQKEANSKFSKIACSIIFQCNEYEDSKAKFTNQENCEYESLNQLNRDKNICENWNEAKAYECVNCMEDLTCEEYPNEYRTNPCNSCKETCGDATISYQEFLKEETDLTCEKIYVCDELFEYRADWNDADDCKVKKGEENKIDTCEDWSGVHGARCITCLKTLSCNQLENSYDNCPVCDEACEDYK